MSKKVVLLTAKVDAVKHVKENGYPEVGMFEDKKSLQKFYKQLDTTTLIDWCCLEGLVYNECTDSEPIQRMRICMAILYKHFPKSPGTTKKKSKYADYTTEALIALAVDNEVVFEITDDMRILRMRAIMALRASKVIE